jgi:hypothetical protein
MFSVAGWLDPTAACVGERAQAGWIRRVFHLRCGDPCRDGDMIRCRGAAIAARTRRASMRYLLHAEAVGRSGADQVIPRRPLSIRIKRVRGVRNR